MTWLLIVVAAGNFQLAKFAVTEQQCEELATFYTEQIVKPNNYICLRSSDFKQIP